MDSLRRLQRYYNVKSVTCESTKQELIDALSAHFQSSIIPEDMEHVAIEECKKVAGAPEQQT